MGAAAAAESPDDANNVTMNSIDDAALVVSEDAGGAESLLGASNDENILSADSGSFKDLDDYISVNKGYGKTLYLDKDYIFNNETDGDYLEVPIYLGTYVSIDGQGHTIDANNNPYIFNTIGQEIILKNINFINTNYRAIEVRSSDVQIIGCTFDNNTGRAVYLGNGALKCVIDDCTFVNGQGVYSGATGAVIRNSLFKNNIAESGGALSIDAGGNVIENCEFINNTATNGGAIYLNGDDSRDLTIKNSLFRKNSATTGGAIYNNYEVLYRSSDKNYHEYHTILNIVSSTFEENIAVQSREIYGPYNYSDSTFDGGKYFDPDIDSLFDGISSGVITLNGGEYTLSKGPITIITRGQLTIDGNGSVINANGNQAFSISQYLANAHVYVNNITIKNAYVSGRGAAFNFYNCYPKTGNANKLFEINNSNFYNNTATGHGGAIYSYTVNYRYINRINNCIFENNSGNAGGAVCLNSNYIGMQIQNSNFTNNSGSTGGAIYHLGGNNQVFKNNHFTNNSANTDGAISIPRIGVDASNTFEGNVAYANPVGSYSGSVVNETGDNIQLSDFPDYIVGGTNCELPNRTFEYPLTLNLVSNTVINGNGSIVIGKGQKLFSSSSSSNRNITLENITLINCAVSGVDNVKNVTFINCTFAPVSCSFHETYFIENVTFKNCTKFIDNSNTNVLYKDVIIDDKKYDNIILYDYIQKLHTDEKNVTVTLPKGEYISLTGYIITSINSVLDGNQSTITIIGDNYLFKVVSDNTTIKNFTIKNANDYPIYYNRHVSGDGIINSQIAVNQATTNYVDNVTFLNCTAGIQYTSSTFGNVSNCIFDNSLKENEYTKQMIYFADDGTVENCTFKNINTNVQGSAIYCAHNLNVTDSSFNNIKSTKDGGAIYINENGTVDNCSFIYCSALSGGAIYQPLNDMLHTVHIVDSDFDNCVVKGSAGALYIGENLILENSNLNNNSADSSGAIYNKGNLTVTNSNLTNNSAVKGGALVSDGDDAVISGCNVSGNTADVGAGISLSGDNAVIDNVNFTDNTASVRGGALVTTGANTNVTNVTATGNSAPSGSAFVLDGDGATLANSTIANNTGVDGEGSAVEVNGEKIDILNNTVHGNDGAGVLVNGNGTNITGNTFNSSRDISINPNSDIYNNQTIMNKLQEENYPAGYVEILNDVEPTIIVSDVNVQQNTTFNITIQNPDFEGNVSVTLNGSVIFNGTFEDIKNNDSIVTGPVLPVAGEKTVTVFFYGDPKFNNKTVTQSFIVSRVTPQMNITVANVTYGNNSVVEVRIGNKANGTITITIDDVEITGIPIVDGNATCDLGVLPGGNKTANVQFRYNTSDYYNDNVGNSTIFCVDKAESSISIVVNGTYDIGEDVNITVSTTGSSGNLTFKINDTVYNVVNGIVNITGGLPLGDYVITATLDADENYTNTEVTRTFIIKKINTDLILLKK